MRRVDEGLAELNKLIAANPEFPPFYIFRSRVYWRQGNLDAFVADQIMVLKTSGRLDEAEAFDAGYRKGKLKGACTALIELLKNKSQREYVSPYLIAVNYARMGDRDDAFEWLEKAYAERSGLLEYIKIDEFFVPFHSDPRYIDLLKRMGFPQQPSERRRPRHPHPETGQGGVREIAIADVGPLCGHKEPPTAKPGSK